MFSIWKPYGFHMENVKRRQFETDTEPFNHTLICICPTNLSEKLSSYVCNVQGIRHLFKRMFPVPRLRF